jgi:hypothetical protein
MERSLIVDRTDPATFNGDIKRKARGAISNLCDNILPKIAQIYCISPAI